MESKEPRKRPPMSNADLFDAVLRGEQRPPFVPRLRSDPFPYHPLPKTLAAFRESEGRTERRKRLHAVWKHLSEIADGDLASNPPSSSKDSLTPQRAEYLKAMYLKELRGRCGGRMGWQEFKEYALRKEEEIWTAFQKLDIDNNGHLDARELESALNDAGIVLNPTTLSDFMTFLASSQHSKLISFAEFRDFLLLLPRKIDATEIYRWYQLRRYMGEDGKGAARVTMEGDVSLSAEDKPPLKNTLISSDTSDDDYDGEEEEVHHNALEGHSALKFLTAGGIAGAVSRTATAPFDRLKIFLMTRPPEMGGVAMTSRPSLDGAKVIFNAVARIYAEGGVLAFWIGNGLSVVKIFPESAIKFFSYESSKRLFAQYWDKVDDPRDIGGSSRFMAGGIGGITSQLSIYPIETLKTQMMSSTGEQKRTILSATRHLWHMGGMKAFYRGLGIGLIGVFPYSAIDMSTFEALKLTYLKSTGKEEPGVLAVLAFGTISGSVGASSVYPLNLVRTRLQAAGSSGHPQVYSGVWDVVLKTYERDGYRGFYRGLMPTLAKVVPAVSISYVVYEESKRRLGV